MKILNKVIIIFLVLELSFADDKKEFVPKEHDWIRELNQARDEKEKNRLFLEYRSSCPFKKENSEMQDLSKGAITLSLSDKMTGKQLEVCQNLVNGANQNYQQVQFLRAQSNSLDIDSDATKLKLQDQLNDAIVASASLRSLAKTQCDIQEDTGPQNIAKVGNHISNVLDTTSTVMMLVNPFMALVGVAASAGTRLITSMSQWLFGKDENELALEAAAADRYISDLCSFRSLALSFDKMYRDPLTNNHPYDKIIKAKKDFSDREEFRLNKTKSLKKMLSCYEERKNEFLIFENLSSEVDRILNASLAQEKSPLHQCLNLMSKYRDNKSRLNQSLQKIAVLYHCDDSNKLNNSENQNEFCKNFHAISSLAQMDFFSLCSGEIFRNQVIESFTKISVVLIHEAEMGKMETVGPIQDRIAQIEKESQLDKIKHEQFVALESIAETNPVVNTSTQKALTNLGHHLLGHKFDDFAENALENSEEGLEETAKAIEDINDIKAALDSKDSGFFVRELSVDERTSKTDQLCSRAGQTKRKMANLINYTTSIRDICTFMSGNGIPPLKNKELNFDIYSTEFNSQDKNIANRCLKLKDKISSQLQTVNNQLSLINTAMENHCQVKP